MIADPNRTKRIVAAPLRAVLPGAILSIAVLSSSALRQ